MTELEQTLQRLNDTLELRLHDRSNTSHRREWYPANEETAQLLGYDDYSQLWDAIKCGLLRVGRGLEVSDRRSPGSSRPRYFVHLQRALDRFETPPEKRAG